MRIAASGQGGSLKAPRKGAPAEPEAGPPSPPRRREMRKIEMIEPNFESLGSGDERPEPQTHFLMLNCMVLTRVTERAATMSGTSTNCDNFDEEVTSYVKSLLGGFSNPSAADDLKPHLFDYDAELLKTMDGVGDGAFEYTVCKTENDLLVLSAAVFDPRDKAPEQIAEFKHGIQGQMGRSGTHYYFAFSYANAVVYLDDTLGAILEKISLGLDKYSTILSYITGHPFDLADRLGDSEVHRLVRINHTTGRRIRLERKQDEFLDAYLEWRSRRTDEAKHRVLVLADELKKLDPTFTYLPEK